MTPLSDIIEAFQSLPGVSASGIALLALLVAVLKPGNSRIEELERRIKELENKILQKKSPQDDENELN